MIITANPLWWHRVESKIKYILGVGNSLCLRYSGQALSIAIYLYSTYNRIIKYYQNNRYIVCYTGRHSSDIHMENYYQNFIKVSDSLWSKRNHEKISFSVKFLLG